jgi:hypothetical protein
MVANDFSVSLVQTNLHGCDGQKITPSPAIANSSQEMHGRAERPTTGNVNM